MPKNKTSYSRKFGSKFVTVSINSVDIIGEYNSNFGTVYRHNIERFKELQCRNYLPYLSCSSVSLFGMDWGYGLTDTIKKFINESIIKLHTK